MAINFIAGGPVGINIIVNHNHEIGSSLSRSVLVASSQMNSMLMIGHKMNPTKTMNDVASMETCPECSPRFSFLNEDRVTPTTATCREAKRSPRLDMEVVCHAFRIPPSSVVEETSV
jgi:hypothetical protein